MKEAGYLFDIFAGSSKQQNAPEYLESLSKMFMMEKYNIMTLILKLLLKKGEHDVIQKE